MTTAYSSFTDAELAGAVANGDEQAFAALFYKYTALLHPYIRKMVDSDAVAKDLMQDIFLRIWMHREQLATVDNLRSWIFTIATNACYNQLRSQSRQEQMIGRAADKAVSVTAPPTVAIELKEIKNAVQVAVSKLSSQRQLIWKMQREQGMKIAEIARQLGLSESTVKNTLAKALEFIREQVAGQGYELSVALLLILYYH